MKTWQKVALGAGALIAVYALGKSSAKPKKKKAKKKTTSPPPGAPTPTPDAPIPQPPAPESEPLPEPAAEVVEQQDFPTSDHPTIPAPVTGKVYKNPDGSFVVRFEYMGGTKDFGHDSLEGAKLRLDSTINKPSEWTCQVDYIEEFDAWVCIDDVNPGDAVARGFLDSPSGPSIWFVLWDGQKFLLFKLANVTAQPQSAGEFNALHEAMQAATGGM